MKIILIFLILTSTFCFGQSQDDYKDYLKEKIEVGEPLGNYKYTLLFSDDILKVHAEKFVGQQLSETQFQNLFFFATEIYLDDTKNQILVDLINTGELPGIRKVSTTKSREKGVDYFMINIYMNSGFISTKFSESVEQETVISLAIKCDEVTANSIKKSFIKLAELSGAKDVVDGDNLFPN